MSNALAKIDFDKEQMAVIESQFFPTGASQAEQQYCFSVAKELCLNPITKEIYFVNRRQKIGDKWVNKVEPMVGRDGFLSIAHRTTQFAGIETTTSIRDIPQMENGQWKMKQQLVADCSVWRKDTDKPFTVQVAYNEYCQKSSDGQPTKFWAEKPETMLKKVAESQALRKAFNIHGVYCPEEVGAGFELASGEIVPSIDADFTRVKEEKPYLASVKAPPAERAPAPPVKQLVQPPLPVQAPTQPRPAQAVLAPPVPAVPVSAAPVPAPAKDQHGDDAGWPDPPPVPTEDEVVDEIALEIIALLKTQKIPYTINNTGVEGTISATSFDKKDLLKSSGFRWAAESRCWIFKFTNVPF